MGNRIIFGKPDIKKEDIQSAVDVLRSGWIGMGAVTEALERAFVKFTGARYAAAVTSGSSGLFLSMLASGIGKGDEVITSPMTFPATASEVIHTGARVRFVDVDSTGNIDAAKIERAVTRKTKAILPIHLHGRPCDMSAVMSLARKHGLMVIEDAAHAFGATYRGKSIGNIGDATVFSLYATKNITAAEGGVVTTSNKKIADRIRLLRSYGITKTAWSRFGKKNNKMPYDTLIPGYNFEIPDLLSAIALSQMKGYARKSARRKLIWDRYNRHFQQLPIGLPPLYSEGNHGMHLYAISVDREKTGMDRETVRRRLNAMGIGTGIHFVSLHLHSYFRDTYGLKPGDFPNALRISRQTLSLPLASGMTDHEVNRVIQSVKRIFNG